MPVDDEINLNKPLTDAQINKLEKDADRMEKAAEKAQDAATRIQSSKNMLGTGTGSGLPMSGKPDDYDPSTLKKGEGGLGEDDGGDPFSGFGGRGAEAGQRKGYRRAGESRSASPLGDMSPEKLLADMAALKLGQDKHAEQLKEAAQERAEIKMHQQQMLSNVGKGQSAINKGFSWSRNPVASVKSTVFGLMQKTVLGVLAVMIIQQIEQLYNQVIDEIKDLFKAGGVLDVRKEMLDQMKQVAELDSLVDAAQGRIYFNSSNGEVLRQGVPQSANTNRAVNGYKQYIQIYDV